MTSNAKSSNNVSSIILLGLRSTYKEDLKATPAQMIYATTLRIPGQFIAPMTKTKKEFEFAKELRKTMSARSHQWPTDSNYQLDKERG